MGENTAFSILEINNSQWGEFLHSCLEANIFHTPAWSRLLAETYHLKPNVIVALDNDNKIVAGLPYLEKRKIFGGNEWISLPYSDHTGVLAVNDSTKKELLNALELKLESDGLKEIEVRSDLPISSWYQIDEKYVIHKLNLAEDTEVIWKGLHSMHRRNVRRAEKRGLRIEQGKQLENIKTFYDLHLDTRQRKGVPIQPWAFFRNLYKILVANDLGFISLVYDGEECVAGAVFLHWGETLTYKYGASSIRANESRANNLMMWSAIEWGCSQGYKTVDMGRTQISNTGLRKYKSRWGAEEFPLIYTTSSEHSNDSLAEKAMDFASPVLQRLPKWFTQASGEIIYRLFV